MPRGCWLCQTTEDGNFQQTHNTCTKMALSIDEIRKEILERKNKRSIDLALLHQNRLRFHVQTEANTPTVLAPLTKSKVQQGRQGIASFGVMQALWDFLAFVENLLPHDKYKTFENLFRFPVATNKLTTICFDKLSRIFEGRDPVFMYRFNNAEYEADWNDYRTNVLHEPDIWKTKGWEYFKTEINSVLVCDLPRMQAAGDRLPRPYFYWLPIRDVIAYSAREDGVMNWIAFRQDGNKLAVMDDEYYRLFDYKDGTLGPLLEEHRHDVGYCPARFFWNEPMSLDYPDVKVSPITKMLGALDWWLFFHISKHHLDLYGNYPVYTGYEQNCDYHNDNTGDYCNGGFLYDAQGVQKLDMAGLPVKCPKCGDKRIIGAGSFIEIPVPVDNQPDLRNPVTMLSVDRGSLDYNVDEEDRLKNDIITSIVGTNEEITTRDALNEQQIKANFESQSTVLNRIKVGFEQAQQWVDATICRLRYGNAFISAGVSYGTEFYLSTADELRERYKTAKEAGASESELDALYAKVIETEYRNNPQMRQRLMILADLEPYNHLTRDEVLTLKDKGVATMEDVILKLNFADYIRKFERENMSVTEFGANIEYDNKIQAISDRLREYVSEDISKLNPQST